MREVFSSYLAALDVGKQPYAKQKWGPISEFWRSHTLSTVNTQTFKDFFVWRRKHSKVKPHTLHKDVVLIRQMLKHAIDEDLLTQMPRIPSVGRIENNPRPWFTPSEWMHLLQTAMDRIETAPNARAKQQRQDVLAMINFLHASMLRVGELRTLHFHSCRVEKRTDGDELLLCEVTGKRGTRTAVAHALAAWIYKERLKVARPGDLIFPHHCRDAFRELLRAADLLTDAQGFRRNLKSVRATAISMRLLDNPELNLTVIARNAGTSVGMIDQFYAKRLTAEMNKQVLSNLPPALAVETKRRREEAQGEARVRAARKLVADMPKAERAMLARMLMGDDDEAA
jgi:site-specific recombinase XerD